MRSLYLGREELHQALESPEEGLRCATDDLNTTGRGVERIAFVAEG